MLNERMEEMGYKIDGKRLSEYITHRKSLESTSPSPLTQKAHMALRNQLLLRHLSVSRVVSILHKTRFIKP